MVGRGAGSAFRVDNVQDLGIRIAIHTCRVGIGVVAEASIGIYLVDYHPALAPHVSGLPRVLRRLWQRFAALLCIVAELLGFLAYLSAECGICICLFVPFFLLLRDQRQTTNGR